ncbi:DUF3857 domain-containing protein [Bacterioplanoides sp.]|uniref:DUF3857 domain-containing transglutaminase family protein n=1 Tax=Bacterioplanoides sp. TaxID=2066072 RepID=UPI003B5A0689
MKSIFSILSLWLISLAAIAGRLAPELTEQQKLAAKSDTGAEVLYSLSESRLKDGLWQKRIYQSIRILDAEAVHDYGRIAIEYRPFYSDLDIEFARVITADGEILDVAQDAIQERVVGGGQDFYSDENVLVFSLPRVAENSILEFQYLRTQKRVSVTDLASDRSVAHWFQEMNSGQGYRADPVQHFSHRIEVLDDTELKHFSIGDLGKASVEQNNGVRSYFWQQQNIPEFVMEPMMSPSQAFPPMIRTSNHDDWSVMDRWAAPLYQPTADDLVAADEIIATLDLKADMSARDKVFAVYRYLQNNLRYVYAHLGRGGFNPHRIRDIVRNGYGDCKDQTFLALTLFRQLGIQAMPALAQLNSSVDINRKLVYQAFDHVLVYLPDADGGQPMWFDTTGDRLQFPGSTSYINGLSAFVLTGQGGEFKRVDNHRRNHSDVTLDMTLDDNNQLIVKATLSPQGNSEEIYRNWWKNDPQGATTLRKKFASLFSDNGSYEFEADVINATSLTEALQMSATFTFKPMDQDPLTLVLGMRQIMMLLELYNALPQPDGRTRDVYIKRPFTADVNVSINVPETRKVISVTSGETIDNDWFSLTQSKQDNGNGLDIKIHYQQKPMEITPEQYEEFFKLITNLSQSDHWYLSIATDQQKALDHELSAISDEKGEDSYDFQINLARRQLDKGLFDDALLTAEKASVLAPEKGESWYVLGTAQGLLGQLEKADESFAKAMELGYAP